jgi:hypothetical protein
VAYLLEHAVYDVYSFKSFQSFGLIDDFSHFLEVHEFVIQGFDQNPVLLDFLLVNFLGFLPSPEIGEVIVVLARFLLEIYLRFSRRPFFTEVLQLFFVQLLDQKIGCFLLLVY